MQRRCNHTYVIMATQFRKHPNAVGYEVTLCSMMTIRLLGLRHWPLVHLSCSSTSLLCSCFTVSSITTAVVELIGQG
jgi:hypothetical protein